MNKTRQPSVSGIEEKVMQKIHNDKPRMQSHWHYLALSALSVMAVVALTFITSYFISIATLWLRIRTAAGPAYGARQNLAALTDSFPWWALLLGLITLVGAIYFLKKTGPMYKFRLIFLAPLVVALVLAIGFIFSYSTLPTMFDHRRSNQSCANNDLNCVLPSPGYRHNR